MDLLLIDNSNIFIEIKSQFSPEARFDYDKFSKQYASSDNLKKILVGSTPPKSDAFWSTMRSKGFEVYTYERKLNGEKAVDTKIIAEGVSHIVQQKHPAKLNLLSGDFDMFPLIEEALKRNWEVNLWSWKGSLSKEYLEITQLKIKYLDEIAGDLIYFNREQNGWFEREYLDERNIRCAREKQEQKFEQDKEDARKKLSRLQYLTNKGLYLSKINDLSSSEQSLKIDNILNLAQQENTKLKKEADERLVEELRQQKEQIRRDKEAKKQKRKDFFEHNWGKFATGATIVIGSIVAYMKKNTK